MKTYAIIFVCVTTLIVSAAKPQPIPGTDLTYKGPGTVSTVTDPDQVADLLTNAPYGGLATVPPGPVAALEAGTGRSSASSASTKPMVANRCRFAFTFGLLCVMIELPFLGARQRC